MPHIHTGKGQYDHTATAYIIRLAHDEPVALLHVHRKLNKLLPIGGHIELTETPWQAMKHELEEESGYTFEDLNLLQPTVRLKSMSDATLHPYPISMNTHTITSLEEHLHSDISYGFIARKLPSQRVDSSESSEFKWVTQVQLNGLNPPEIHQNTKEVYNFIFNECLSNWEEVDPFSFAT